MNITSRARLFAVAAGISLFAAACADGGTDFDSGAADITIERDGVEPLRLVHDPELSQVTLTPPTEGIIELVFAYQDPLVTLRLVVNSELVVEGVEVPFPVASPLSPDDVLLTLEIDDVIYTSDDAAATGFVLFDVLEIDEENDYADVIATFDAVLVGTNDSITLSGSVEGRVGDRDDL
jgi:hypothetical protein